MVRLYSPKMTFLRVSLIVYVAFLAYFTLGPGMPAGVAGIVTHFAAYLGLGVLTSWSFPDRFEQHRFRTVAEIILLGLVLELGRVLSGSVSLLDIGVNTLGAALSWLEPEVRALFSGEEESEEEIQAGDLEPAEQGGQQRQGNP